MKIIFEVAHPKHYYQFKNVIKLLCNSHDVKIVARKKDIVCRLLDAEGVEYDIYGGHGKNMRSKFFILPDIFLKYISIVKKFKPDLIISKSSPYAVLVGRLFRIKTCIMPDSEVVTFNNRFVVPHSDLVITPRTYSLDHGIEHKRVDGFFEDGYLHPRFLDKEILDAPIEGLSDAGDGFAILRFVGWPANHDVAKFGFSEDEKIKLVNLIEKHCEVLISSEGPLPSSLEKYRFKAPVNKMHHALFKASLYIGDSQTMATEAALCGTPAIRYNSFVGEKDMSNFKILENKGMLFNVSEFEDVCRKANEVIQDGSSKRKAQEKRDKYFQEAGDVNKEMAELITS